MKALAFTISFLLAFLLFAVQPMATKMVLPTLGGTPAVWNTAMLTFQLLLLAGYAYAHVLTQKVPGARQWLVHGGIVVASCFLLPLAVQLPATDAVMRAPISHLALAFLLQLGLPFFVLSATAPLLQSWVSRSQHPLSKTPYVLYSASNFGSMMGLLGYVAVVEPLFALPQQSQGWSVLYVVGLVGLLLLGQRLKPAAAATQDTTHAEPLPRSRVALWVWLAFLASSLSLGVTTYVTTDIAAVPLLWVLPLSLYLLSFVDAFRDRPVFVPSAIRLSPILGMGALLIYGLQGHRFAGTFLLQIVIFGVLAFALHGWLARFKPSPARLTQFYFAMSIGGALGGVLNALVAPMLFTQTYEYPLSLLCASMTLFLLRQQMEAANPLPMRTHVALLVRVASRVVLQTVILYIVFGLLSPESDQVFSRIHGQNVMMACTLAAFISLLVYRRFAPAFYAVATVGVILLAVFVSGTNNMDLLFKKRNFFGVQHVYANKEDMHLLMHNTTLHGTQRVTKDRLKVVSYYYGLRKAFETMPLLREKPLATVGLGVGTVKCLLKPGQSIDFFEINPVMQEIAENEELFTYLSDCPGEHRIILGDGRIKMAEMEDGKYGAIIIDAFSSDAIPAHLLTKESLQMYMEKLAPHGVLMVHTTNRHIDLWPVMAAQADALGVHAYARIFGTVEEEPLAYTSYWVFMVRDADDLKPLRKVQDSWVELKPEPGTSPWTDNYTNVIPYFRMVRGK